MSKFILVHFDRDAQLKRYERIQVFEDFEIFKETVNSFLQFEDGAKSIILAGEVSREWEFNPVEVVTKYVWNIRQ